MNKWKIAGVTVLAVLIVIQFIRPHENEGKLNPAMDIASVVPVPDSVHRLLKSACYNCHSNHTDYPWYEYIQPVAWYLNHHINEAKDELNFSEFAGYSKGKQEHMIEHVGRMVQHDEMPISSYKLMHPEARLSEGEKKIIVGWASNFSKQHSTFK